MIQRVIFGKITKPENENISDLNGREKLVLIPLVILIFWIGIYPKPFLARMEPAVKSILNMVHKGNSNITENKNIEIDELSFFEDDSIRYSKLIDKGDLCQK